MISSGQSKLTTKPKLLVVDDEPDNLDLLYRTFHRDFKVLRAESGPEALEVLAREGEVAVIISDQRMPLMSGTEFLSLTATQYPDIIRIILTGYTDVDDLVEAINSGKVFKYVTKPWDDDELKGVVHQAIDTHNVLKTRTYELRRTLRQESLINTVTRALRGAFSSKQILQTIVETIGQMFDADFCVLRPCHNRQMEPDVYVYRALSSNSGTALETTPLATISNTISGSEREGYVHSSPSPISESVAAELANTLWEVEDVQVVERPQSPACPIQNNYREPPPESDRACQTLGIRSSLLVPLIYQQELIAIIAIHHSRFLHPWQDDDVQLVTLVADQVALALSQARTYEQVRALAKRETLVNMITSVIRSSLEPEEIFASITQQLGQALHVDGCALSLWTCKDTYVQCVGLYDAAQRLPDGSPGRSHHSETWTSPLLMEGGNGMLQDQNPAQEAPDLPQSLVPIGENPVLKQLMETLEPVVVKDLNEQPALKLLDVPLRSSTRALLVVPLLSDGTIIGSISMRQARSPREWQPDEIGLAQAVAAQAAIAVQQARLYQTTRQQAEKLLELNRQRTEFFQNISHEFRTPLTLNIGPLESAVARQEGLSSEQSAIALRNARRLLRLVNQLLDLQRMDAGRMQLVFRPCNMTAFVRQIVETFRPYCEKQQVNLITELGECPTVYLDVEKFDKVLYNLLSNAVKFTQAGDRICLTVWAEGDRCFLQVQDTGIGIRDDQIPYLFERFRQADGSTNRSYEGSGLGLSLVKELVELHGGDISVTSIYGEGTTFTITLLTGSQHLPTEQVSDAYAEIELSRAVVELADVETEVLEVTHLESESQIKTIEDVGLFTQQNELSSEVADETAPLILVVDDNPDLRHYVRDILEQENYQVSTARNGAEGLQRAQAQHPHLILTDLMMPHMSGLEMIQAIREDEAIKGTPIVLLTAKADEETRIEGAEQGADAYLSKPFNHRELLAEVRNLLALKESERRVAELNRYLTESVLQRFLPASLVEKAAHGQLALDLRPEPRLVTILFSDIVGFAQLSNTLRSRRVAELLNEYLTEMTHAIFDNGGTVDKFMGDAILAIFGAPEEISPNEQVKRAIAAARQMNQALQRLNSRWHEHGIPDVQFRCGIHQGTAVVGMFGSIERSDYTAIGPSVNIAARIQEAADPGSILVSAAVADYLDDTAIQKYSPLKLKGIDETVLTFSIKTECHDD